MKVAYLVLCHKEPTQINLLLRELIKDGSDCYIHIDRKSKMSRLDFVKSDQIFFVPDDKRVDIRWAANSMVRATIELINSLIQGGRRYDYVCLLSGQDFPIKNSQLRNAFLEKNRGYNFIEVLSHDDYKYKRYNKRSLLYFPDYLYNGSFWSRVLRKLYIIISGGYTKTFDIFKRLNTSGVHFEYGSQWWCMTYECILWMRKFIEEYVNVDYFDHAITPDECFFQSVFMMSPFRDMRKDKVMYLEWEDNDNHPRILGAGDYYNLMNTPDKLFARKFDITVDKTILERLSNPHK